MISGSDPIVLAIRPSGTVILRRAKEERLITRHYQVLGRTRATESCRRAKSANCSGLRFVAQVRVNRTHRDLTRKKHPPQDFQTGEKHHSFRASMTHSASKGRSQTPNDCKSRVFSLRP